MLKFSHFFEELRSRNVRKTMAIYVSSALTAIGVTKLLIEVYDIPEKIFPVVVTILLSGVASAFIFAWFHGREGGQKFYAKELVLHLAVLSFAVFVAIRIGSGSLHDLPAQRLGKSIAVLPFKNMSGNKEDEYFSDGITEDILTQLCKIGELRVISRTSIIQYKETKKSLRTIGEELGVAAILEGSVRRTGTRVRIVSQLINAKSDEHIWAETYDRDMSDIFAIQTDVATRIARALQAALSPKEKQLVEKKSTESIEAYALYLRGRDYAHARTRQANERAIELFEKSLAIDTNYALAYAGLADAYVRKQNYDAAHAWIDSATRLCYKALSLDPGLAEGYKALGDIYDYSDQRAKALELFMKAVDLNPNYPNAINNIGYVYFRMGAYDKALQWMKRALGAQPESSRWHANIGVQYFFLGCDSLASLWERKALTLDPEFFFPAVVLTYIDLFAKNFDSARTRIDGVLQTTKDEPDAFGAAGDVELIAGNYEKAMPHYRRAVDLTAPRSDWGVKLAFVLLQLNRRSESKELVKTNIVSVEKDLSRITESATAYYSAAAYCLDQNHPQALRLLRRAIEVGFSDYRWMSVDPMFFPLRNDREFLAIQSAVQSKIDGMRKRVGDEMATGGAQ